MSEASSGARLPMPASLNRAASSGWDEDNEEEKFYDPEDVIDSETRSASGWRQSNSKGQNIFLSIASNSASTKTKSEHSEDEEHIEAAPVFPQIRLNETADSDEDAPEDGKVSSAPSPLLQRDDPVDESNSKLKNQVVNLDTGEIMGIEQMDGLVDTFASLRCESSEADHEVTEEEKLSHRQAHVSFFSKVFHRGALSESPETNAVKVKVHKKSEMELSDLRCMQEISEHIGPVWTMKWSPCGSFLATAGQDSIVRVWVVIGSEPHRKMLLEQAEKNRTQQSDADATNKNNINNDKQEQDQNSAAASESSSDVSSEDGPFGRDILVPVPYRTYSGHKEDVIDLAWSKSSFLLSASMDRTVRLWHVSKQRCLSSFQHADYVTSVCFHPTEARLYLSGSFDKKLRMWNILEHRVVDWAQTPTMITSATFSPGGNLAAAGLYNGQCIFYNAEGLKYYTQIDCRNRHGKHRKGRKVTGLQFSSDGKQLLVSTNDSRVRLYDMDDFSMCMKYKGLDNETLQIRAHFSENDEHIISGSDDSGVFLWKTNKDYGNLKNAVLLRNRNDRNDSYEHFKAHDGIVTVALLAPSSTLEMVSRRSSSGTGAIKHLIVSAGFDGKIKLFENRAEPVRL